MRSAGNSPASASVSRCAAKAAWDCEWLDSSAAYVLAKLSHAAGICRHKKSVSVSNKAHAIGLCIIWISKSNQCLQRELATCHLLPSLN